MFSNFSAGDLAVNDEMRGVGEGRVRQAVDDNIIRRMRIACCITKAVDTLNVYWFYTATLVTRTHLSVTLYLHFRSYLINHR